MWALYLCHIFLEFTRIHNFLISKKNTKKNSSFAKWEIAIHVEDISISVDTFTFISLFLFHFSFPFHFLLLTEVWVTTFPKSHEK